MMEKILISDIHGVLADIHTPWLDIYNQESGDDLTVEEITAWNIGSFVLPGWSDKLWEIYERDSLPEMTPPIQGALEGITRLREMGWRILFVTSPSNKENPYRWHSWLVKHQFTDTLNDFIPARDKTVFRARAIVDDNFTTVKEFHAVGGIGLLYDRPWNRSDDVYHRMENWQWVVAALDDDELVINNKIDTARTALRFRELGLMISKEG